MAYEKYIANERSHEPTVTKQERGYVISWGPADEVFYTPTEYDLELCRLVAPECLAASMFFETGITPEGTPYGEIPAWRFELWKAYNTGMGKRFKRDDDDEEEEERRPIVWKEVRDANAGGDAGSQVG